MGGLTPINPPSRHMLEEISFMENKYQNIEAGQRGRTALGWKVELRQTGEEDLPNVARLWNDGAVMYYVGFPDGLGVTLEHLRKEWLPWVHSKPGRNHWSIYAEGVGYCGETFYDVDETGLASMDIKLLPEARGKAIAYYALDYALGQAFTVGGASRAYVAPNPENRPAWALYERLGFRPAERPAHLEPADTYLEMTREEYLARRN